MGIVSAFQHSLLQYHGIDWAVMILGFASAYLIGSKHPMGQLIAICSCCFGVVFSFEIGSVANAISSIILLCLAGRGYYKWSYQSIALPEK